MAYKLRWSNDSKSCHRHPKNEEGRQMCCSKGEIELPEWRHYRPTQWIACLDSNHLGSPSPTTCTSTVWAKARCRLNPSWWRVSRAGTRAQSFQRLPNSTRPVAHIASHVANLETACRLGSNHSVLPYWHWRCCNQRWCILPWASQESQPRVQVRAAREGGRRRRRWSIALLALSDAQAQGSHRKPHLGREESKWCLAIRNESRAHPLQIWSVDQERKKLHQNQGWNVKCCKVESASCSSLKRKAVQDPRRKRHLPTTRPQCRHRLRWRLELAWFHCHVGTCHCRSWRGHGNSLVSTPLPSQGTPWHSGNQRLLLNPWTPAASPRSLERCFQETR